MALTFVQLNFNLHIIGNKTNEKPDGSPDIGAAPTGQKGYQEWLTINIPISTNLINVIIPENRLVQLVHYNV